MSKGYGRKAPSQFRNDLIIGWVIAGFLISLLIWGNSN